MQRVAANALKSVVKSFLSDVLSSPGVRLAIGQAVGAEELAIAGGSGLIFRYPMG